jgi:hypothetical protein
MRRQTLNQTPILATSQFTIPVSFLNAHVTLVDDSLTQRVLRSDFPALEFEEEIYLSLIGVLRALGYRDQSALNGAKNKARERLELFYRYGRQTE